MHSRQSTRGILLFAAAVLFATAAPADAVGYWNMPTTMCQWWGYGCGPGYHAPMVLGPNNLRGVCGFGKEIRLPRSPRPTYGYDCPSGGCGMVQPSILEPPAAPLPQPEPELVPQRAASFPSPPFVLQ